MEVTYTEDDKNECYNALKLLEGFKPKAYLDKATPPQITIGVGSNIQDSNNAGARKIAIDAVILS